MALRSPSGRPREPIPVVSLDECLAKTFTNAEGQVEPGLDVFAHCLAVGLVARELVARSLEEGRALFPPGSELVAAAHDVGKVSPTFQKKLLLALGRTLVGWEAVDVSLEDRWGHHAGVSEAALEGVGRYLPQIVGRHHGSSPELALYDKNSEVFGGVAWQALREELLERLKSRLGVGWPRVDTEVQALVVSGLTTVADWIASGSLDRPELVTPDAAALALDRAGLKPAPVVGGRTFEALFGFPPRDTQRLLSEVCQGPGVYVVEAPMGQGKTEAALYAAYRVLEQGRATGIYFALPTQLTSNKIHERMERFLEGIGVAGARLVHGGSHLVDTDWGEEGQPGGSWFTPTKRGLLAPFAVGTVDQALMSVLNVRHGFVRAYGLVGKVVILDEVHSYDAYTGTILDVLVRTLVDLGCTVIILSATLTRNRRAAFLEAVPPGSDPYPLVSVRRAGEPVLERTPEPPASIQVLVRRLDDDAEALEEALARAEAGQQVLWIENTVAEAQDRFLTLASRGRPLGVECGLLHSRFLKVDRQRREGLWVGLLGAKGQSEARRQGRILVGTQVLEQSLDLDADFLVTRLAPTDLVLQRMGRLWRHRDNDPIRPAGCRPEAWILGPETSAVVEYPEASLGKSGVVYAPYVLYRTAEVWEGRDHVVLPGDIRPLLEATYADRPETGVPARMLHELNQRRQKLQGLARVGLSRGGKTLPESASTRYSEVDTVDVLVLRRFDRGGQGVELTLVDGSVLSLPAEPQAKGRPQWRRLARDLQLQTVTVSVASAPPAPPEAALTWLKPYLYIDGLRVALVDETGDLRPLVEAGPWGPATYDEDLGYRFEKGGSV